MNKQNKQSQAQRISAYRARPDRVRLELMVSPELAERFRQLAGLEKKSNADRLQALCELWESQLPVAATGSRNSSPLDLDKLAEELDAFSKQLEQEDAADSAHPPKKNALLTAKAHNLYKRRWPKRPPQRPEKWETVLRNEPEVRSALARVRAICSQIADLIEAGLLPISVDEVRALGQLAEGDFKQVLEQLAEKGKLQPHLCGEAGQRLELLSYQQPRRSAETWELLHLQ